MGKKQERPGSDAGTKKSWMKPAAITAVVVLSLSAGVGVNIGVSALKESPKEAVKKRDHTGGNGNFPSYVASSRTPNAEKGYRFAVDYAEELDQIPCFCGCGGHAGHKSVRYCFIEQYDKRKENILFDPHGAGCKMCVDIVLDTVEGLEDGDSLKDVRARIEEQWKDQKDSMTPTPPIES